MLVTGSSNSLQFQYLVRAYCNEFFTNETWDVVLGKMQSFVFLAGGGIFINGDEAGSFKLKLVILSTAEMPLSCIYDVFENWFLY